MKQDFHRHKRASESALTLVDVLAILAVIAVLLALLVPQLARVFHRSAKATCVDNLRQVGLAFRTWSTDSSDDFPMKRSIKRGGSAEFVLGGNPDRHFFCLSNELMTSKVLVCPSDSRQPATNFLSLTSSNVSYFVGVDAEGEFPDRLLAGDRNLVTNGVPILPGLLVLQSTNSIGFSAAMHNGQGNVGLSDGSVQQVSSAGLQTLMQKSGTNIVRLGVP